MYMTCYLVHYDYICDFATLHDRTSPGKIVQHSSALSAAGYTIILYTPAPHDVVVHKAHQALCCALLVAS